MLVTLDTTRADHLSCYGYVRKTSPRLDALAADSVVYDRCISTSSWTLPAHASLFTGRYPTSHGAIHDPNAEHRLTAVLPDVDPGFRANALSDRIETLATALKRHGYVTGALIGGPWLKRLFGLAQGFDYYDDTEISSLNGRLAEQINRRALPWIDKVANQPFLLFVNYFDAHFPYAPPERFQSRFLKVAGLKRGAKGTLEEPVDLYDAEIYYADHFLGKLVDHLHDLGLYDDTWIIITADHGELFGEHGLFSHGATLYEPEVRAPLVIKYPKRWAQRGRNAEPIQLTDIMPMILDRLGFPTPAHVQGTSPGQPRRRIFAEVYPLPVLSKRGSHRAYYEGDLKYVWNSRGRHMLFDLKADPDEEHNLYGLKLEKARAMRTAMETLVKELPRPYEVAVTRIDQETLETLRGLGYITAPTSASKPMKPTSSR